MYQTKPWALYDGRLEITSAGRTTLAAAFADVLKVRTDFDAYELSEIFAAPLDGGENDVCRELVRLEAETFAAAFVGGRIRTFARPISGGEIISVGPELWEVDDPLPRFAFGGLNLSAWAEPDAPCTHRLFVDTAEFNGWLAVLPEHGPLSDKDVSVILDPRIRMVAEAKSAARVSTGRDRSHSSANHTAICDPSLGPEFLRDKEVAKLAGISRTRIYELMKRGEFPKHRKIGHSSRWIAEEVRDWKRAIEAS